MERLKLSLSFVNEREKKQKGLITAKLKLEKQLKEAKSEVWAKCIKHNIIK